MGLLLHSELIHRSFDGRSLSPKSPLFLLSHLVQVVPRELDLHAFGAAWQDGDLVLLGAHRLDALQDFDSLHDSGV